MKPLFAYGTFRRTAWREAILGARYPGEPATLRGWRRVATRSGYLSLRETVVELGPVSGVLIALDALGWEIADAWEEVPAYMRVDVVVDTMHGLVAAQMYVYADERHTQPIDEDRLTLLSDAEVEAAIAAFAPTMRGLRERA